MLQRRAPCRRAPQGILCLPATLHRMSRTSARGSRREEGSRVFGLGVWGLEVQGFG